MPYLGEYKELPEGHPFKGAHVFFNQKPQASSPESSTEFNLEEFNRNEKVLDAALRETQPQLFKESPQEKFVKDLENRGIKVNVMSKNDLARRQQDNPKLGEWPKE